MVMALMAISVNAKVDIDFSKVGAAGETIEFGNWEWKDVTLLSTGDLIRDDEAKTADDSGVSYFDASAYDYLVLKYKECTIKTNFILQYNFKGSWGQWGPEYNSETIVLNANSTGLVGIKLSELKDKVDKIALQTQGSGSLAIEELYWASEAEYNDAVAANPETKYVKPTKDLDISNATGGWGDKTYDAETHVATINANDAASGWWSDGDFSEYDYFVIEVENLVKVGYGQFSIYNNNFNINEGSFVKVCDISSFDKKSGTNVVIQGGAGTTWTWKRAYYATAAYIEENGIKDEMIYGDTQELSLANLNGGWDAEYDTETKTITVTGADGGGKAWWLGADGFDYSHFDNMVIEFNSATTTDGNVTVEYAESTGAAQNRVEFHPGATCVVVPLDATGKSAIKQIYVAGKKDATFALKSAFLAVASATPEAQLGTAPTWTVAGNFVGSSWDQTDTNNDMTSEDGTTYTLVKEGVLMEAGTNYQFKVVKNHDWAESYPADNYTFTVEETGIYTVTVTFNADTKVVSHEAVKTGDAGPVEHTYSVTGTINGDWDKDTDMTKGDDGLFTATFTDVLAGTYKFKVRVDHDWAVSYPISDYELTVENDGSIVTITFNEETKEVNATVKSTTGIETAKTINMNSVVRYNLAGQKVDAAYKGVIIENGRKIVVK